MARLTKDQIAQMIEELPGNIPWGFHSIITIYTNYYTRQELLDFYNRTVQERGLDRPLLS